MGKYSIPTSPPVIGIYDTVDKCWIGNDDGPKTFSDWEVARAAATIYAMQLGYGIGRRLRAQPYDKKASRLRDEVKTVMSAEKAIKELEELPR